MVLTLVVVGLAVAGGLVVFALGSGRAPLGELEVVRPPALDAAEASLASVSPTGSRVLVEREVADGESELCVHEIADASPLSCVLAPHDEVRADPAYVRWSPQEDLLALSHPLDAPFTHLFEGTLDVFLIDVDRAVLDNLTAAGLSGAGRADSGHSNYHMPTFSPDGSSLAALRQDPQHAVELVEIDLDADLVTPIEVPGELVVGTRLRWYGDEIWLDPPRSDSSVAHATVVDTAERRSELVNVEVADVIFGGPGRGEIVEISDDGTVALLHLRAHHHAYHESADLSPFAVLDTTTGRAALVRPDVGEGTEDPHSAFFGLDWAHLSPDGNQVVFVYEHADGAAGVETRDGAGATSLRVSRSDVSSILQGERAERIIVDDLPAASELPGARLVSSRERGTGMTLPLPSENGWLMVPLRGGGEQVLVKVQVEGE